MSAVAVVKVFAARNIGTDQLPNLRMLSIRPRRSY